MTRHSQRSECTEISAVNECDQAEWYDDKEDCLLVDMPTEQKRGVATERDSTNKCLPGRLREKSKEHRLREISYKLPVATLYVRSEHPRSR